ncbi:ATP-dependent protease La (LON) domain protein [Quillaja saponaria]|uniref:ATP-dependent protease La (LON) domain protein n=1 Tax=Quillaja saponaria TaxID=32244 RepID=A0AAD7PBR3_QUISA|nr:ATP-dependent protease La (LON) domain protein [Quillaja saponaria]
MNSISCSHTPSSSSPVVYIHNAGFVTRQRLCFQFPARGSPASSCSFHFGIPGVCSARNTMLRPMKRECLTQNASSLELPLLPFVVNEVLVPTESKTLHIYEARFLALLDECLTKTKGLFVHFVLDPTTISDSSAEVSFSPRYGCLVERLNIGALVSIRGISRVKTLKFIQEEPYLKGEIVPMRDKVCESLHNAGLKVTELNEAMYNLNSLEIKIKAPKQTLLQTRIANSLMWAERGPSLELDEAFIPSMAELVAFAALQPVSGSTPSELLKLKNKKLKAMVVEDTIQRLNSSLEHVKETTSLVAAKLAIQSLRIE